MSEQIELKKIEKPKNMLYSQVGEDLYKRVYSLSKEYGVSMSEVIRLCLERALPEVQKGLHYLKRGR